MIDIVGLVSIPASITGNIHISAVLDGDAEFGVASALYNKYSISRGEALDIAVWLVGQSGRPVKTLLDNSNWHWGKSDTAVREAVHGAVMSIATK